MAADTVITYILFGLPPRRVRRKFPASVPARLIVSRAPKGAFAYLTPDGVTHYIDDTRAIERVRQDALIALISDIIADNRTVTNADKVETVDDVKLGAELYRQELRKRIPLTPRVMGI